MFRHIALLVHGLENFCSGCVCCAATGAHPCQLGLAKAKRDAMQLPVALATLVAGRPLRVQRELWDCTQLLAAWALADELVGNTALYCTVLYRTVMYCTVLYCP